MTSVSVIITSFNSGPFLERATRSVLAQTMQDFEIIVVDDGSAHPQAEIVRLDDRIRFHSQPNRGVSIARNVGASLAKAELIAFLDHDDEWLPEKLERQLECVESNPDAAFWMTGFDWVMKDVTKPANGKPIDYRGMLRATAIPPSTVMIRKMDYFAVGGHNPLLTHSEDGDLFLRLTMEGRSPAVVADRLVRYNLHDSNASLNYREISEGSLLLLRQHENRAQKRNDIETLAAIDAGRARARELFAFQAIDALRTRRPNEWRIAGGDFIFALRSKPSVAIGAIALAAKTRLRRGLRRQSPDSADTVES